MLLTALVQAARLPAEIHDPAIRARLEASPAGSPASGEAQTGPRPGLTGTQIAVAAGFGIFVFAGIFLVLLTLAR